MKIRLYLDEDSSQKALLQALRNADIDVISTLEVENLSRSDSEQLIYATEQQRVIYTYNMGDFCRLHKTYMEQKINHAGIIVVERQNYSVGEQLKGLLRLIEIYSAEAIRNQLIFIGTFIRDNEV